MHFDKNVYNSLLLALDSDSLSLDATQTLQGRARVDATSGVWVIGPGTIEYSLSTFLAVRPFLLQAAGHGRANIVKRLTRPYGCDVKYQDRDVESALHLAAYFGHADVVAKLLDSGLLSDHTIKNKMGEKALDSAKAAQEAYDNNTFNFPKLSTSVSTGGGSCDFTTRVGWPGWGEIIRLLEAASVDKAH
jgi:hypothetical protein